MSAEESTENGSQIEKLAKDFTDMGMNLESFLFFKKDLGVKFEEYEKYNKMLRNNYKLLKENPCYDSSLIMNCRMHIYMARKVLTFDPSWPLISLKWKT